MPYDFETIGPYTIVEILGQGGMGTVYKGVHAKTEEPVAIKVISSAMAQHARFRRRFDAEIQTLLRLKHPNIVQLIGYGEERGLLFYSMEYVDGENLHQMLRREKRFPWNTVLDWAIEIGSALKHAHDFGIIHRDLKPANLMINPQGHVKLTDFGIAKLFGSTEQTVPGSVLGTADFMPPEQAEGKPVTVRSDLYALGAICYASIAGRTPFIGSNVPEILFNVRYGSFTPLRELAPECPEEFSDLIEELLRRDPSQRPPTAIVVNKRLQSLRVGLSRMGTMTAAPTPETSRPDSQPPHPAHARDATELTSLDMSDHPSIAGLSDDPERTRMIGSVQTPTEVPKTPPKGNPPLSKNARIAGPHEATQLAMESPVSSMPEIPSGIGQVRSTNFTQVTDSDRKRSTLVISDGEDHDTKHHWLSIGGTIALLLACIAAAYWFSRPPSPDTLYRPIAEAMESADESRIESIEDNARRFIELFPDDPRATEVGTLIEGIEIDRVIRQLQRRAGDTRATHLDALEQAFVDGARLANVNPQEAKKKLQALLVVFPTTDEMSLRQRKIVSAAQRLLERLNSEPTDGLRNVAAESLQAQMRWAETHLSREQRNEWLRSMILLYQEKPWAAELVAAAKQMIATEQ